MDYYQLWRRIIIKCWYNIFKRRAHFYVANMEIVFKEYFVNYYCHATGLGEVGGLTLTAGGRAGSVLAPATELWGER